jgi:uncharacterized membrane protein
MKRLLAFGFGIFIAGFYLAFLNDCWSYFSKYSVPSSDVFYVLMMMIWHMYPFMIMFLGLLLLFVGVKKTNIMEVDD